MAIQGLSARVFFSAFDRLRPQQYCQAREATLEAAIRFFTMGNCHHMMFHEGLNSAPRNQLRLALGQRNCQGVTVEPARLAAYPEVRLSDAIAGYIRGELFRGDGARAVLANLPDLFVDLQLKMRNPPDCSGG
jgi:hypothetical protein